MPQTRASINKPSPGGPALAFRNFPRGGLIRHASLGINIPRSAGNARLLCGESGDSECAAAFRVGEAADAARGGGSRRPCRCGLRRATSPPPHPQTPAAAGKGLGASRRSAHPVGWTPLVVALCPFLRPFGGLVAGCLLCVPWLRDGTQCSVPHGRRRASAGCAVGPPPSADHGVVSRLPHCGRSKGRRGASRKRREGL